MSVCKQCDDGRWECGEESVVCNAGGGEKKLGVAYIPTPDGYAVPVEVSMRTAKNKKSAVVLRPPAGSVIVIGTTPK